VRIGGGFAIRKGGLVKETESGGLLDQTGWLSISSHLPAIGASEMAVEGA
jgi:hypothetical protein